MKRLFILLGVCAFGSIVSLPLFASTNCGSQGGSVIYMEGGGSGEDVNPPPGTESSGEGDADLSIRRFELREDGTSGYRHEIVKSLMPGESFRMTGELKLKNKGGNTAEDVDIDYRVDHDRGFTKNDSRVDKEGALDISGGDSVIKHMASIEVKVSSDGANLIVENKDGNDAEAFPMVNGFAKFYVFVDAEVDGGDDDISSDFSGDNEYGVVKVSLMAPPPTPGGGNSDYANSPCGQAGYTIEQCVVLFILN